MKYLIAMMFLVSTNAMGWHKTTYLNPGECMIVKNHKICAAPQYAEQQPTTVEKMYAFCSLEKYGSNPSKMWVLYQAATNSKGHTKKTRLKAYPHFEGSECKDEASRISE